jgi:hypothetical protein
MSKRQHIDRIKGKKKRKKGKGEMEELEELDHRAFTESSDWREYPWLLD